MIGISRIIFLIVAMISASLLWNGQVCEGLLTHQLLQVGN